MTDTSIADDPRARLEALRRISELRGKMSPEEVVAQGPSPSNKDFTVGQKLLGSAETLLGLGTQVAAGIPNLTMVGLAAGGDVLLRQASGYGNPTEQSQQIVEDYNMIRAYTPRSEAGQQVSEAAAWVFNLPFEALEKIAKSVQDKQIALAQSKASRTGQDFDAPGAAIPTTIQTLPDIIGSLAGVQGGRMLSRGPDVKRIRQEAEDLGIDLGAPYEQQVAQSADAGQFATGTGSQGN